MGRVVAFGFRSTAMTFPHFSVRGDGLPSFLLSLSLWLSRNKDVVSEKLGKREPLDVTATPAVIRRTSVVSNGNVSLRREKQETRNKNKKRSFPSRGLDGNAFVSVRVGRNVVGKWAKWRREKKRGRYVVVGSVARWR